LIFFINQRVKYPCCIKNQKNDVTYYFDYLAVCVGEVGSAYFNESFLEAGSLQEQMPVSTAILVDKCCHFFLVLQASAVGACNYACTPSPSIYQRFENSATDICAKDNVCVHSRHLLNVFCPVFRIFAVMCKQDIPHKYFSCPSTCHVIPRC